MFKHAGKLSEFTNFKFFGSKVFGPERSASQKNHATGQATRVVFFNTIKFHQISVKPTKILEITKGWLMVDEKKQLFDG